MLSDRKPAAGPAASVAILNIPVNCERAARIRSIGLPDVGRLVFICISLREATVRRGGNRGGSRPTSRMSPSTSVDFDLSASVSVSLSPGVPVRVPVRLFVSATASPIPMRSVVSPSRPRHRLQAVVVVRASSDDIGGNQVCRSVGRLADRSSASGSTACPLRHPERPTIAGATSDRLDVRKRRGQDAWRTAAA
jgi:hypothetical protein